MRHPVVLAVAFAQAFSLGGAAYALKPAVHRSIALGACRNAGLPHEFCERVGAADYDTDANEWNDLSAHAQIDSSQTTCEAADAAAFRLSSLGGTVRDALISLAGSSSSEREGEDAERAADALGRALHTIQDDCAHHGMPNPQHAWASLSDFCQGTSESPDIQTEAIACATRETATLFAAFTEALDSDGVRRGALDGLCSEIDPCPLYLPAPWEACSFLGEAVEWDGVDRQWNNERVLPALRDALFGALRSGAVAPELCDGDPTLLAAARPAPISDVSDVPSCFRAHLLCLGKADSAEANAAAADFFGEAPATTTTTGGCQLAPGRAEGGGLALGVMMALALLALAARRRPGSPRGRGPSRRATRARAAGARATGRGAAPRGSPSLPRSR